MDQSTREEIKSLLYDELSHFLNDIEFRLAQTYAVTNRQPMLYAEDICDNIHRITGYTVTANSPSGGSIAWASVHIVYNGVDYTLTNGNTALKYTWFDAALSTTVLQSN